MHLKPARSIERQLPVLMTATLLVLMAVLTVAASREIHHSRLAAASQQVARIATQLASTSATQTPTRLAELGAVAADPLVRGYARDRKGRPDRPLQILAALDNDPQVVEVELRDHRGDRLLSTRHPDPPPAASSHWAPPLDTLGVSPMSVHGDAVHFEYVVPVTEESGAILGYVVQRRRISNTPQVRRFISNLMGNGGALLIGNRDGTAWTDLDRVVTGPPLWVLAARDAAEYVRDGAGTRLGTVRPIEGTPWVILVEFTRRAVLAPLNAFLIRMSAVAAILLIAGGTASLVMSRRIARRLRGVSEAASAIAAGQYSRRVVVGPRDEIGQLADSFNVMAGTIEHAQSRLEGLVSDLQEHARLLEQSNRALEEFASVASHDLQEPLRKVQIFGQRLEETFRGGLDERGRDYLHRMLDAARRMQTFIQDLLALSRVTREGKQFEATDLNGVVADVLSLLEARIDETAAHIQVSALPTLQADPLQMRQLLQNLVSNALKFRHRERPLIVQVTGDIVPTRPDGPVTGAVVHLEVRDNGIGFEGREANRIFEPFRRLHGRNTYEGNGIGLALCRKIVDRHRGTITAEAQPGEGAAFIVTLPVEQPEPALGSDATRPNATAAATPTVRVHTEGSAVSHAPLKP